MSWFKIDIALKTCGDKIGYFFNNTLFNVSSSAVGTGFKWD
jgi:hypothetical protein